MKNQQPLFYLASPYSSPDKDLQKARAEQAAEASAILKRLGHHIFAPIPMGVMMAAYGLPHGYEEFWKPFAINMISRCDALIVLTLDGWRESVGVTDEIAEAMGRGLPVFYVPLNDARRGKVPSLLI
jgi:hypothetical protein